MIHVANLVPSQASDNVTRLGVAVLHNFDVFPEEEWYWIGIAALFGFAALFNVLFTFALMYQERRNTATRHKTTKLKKDPVPISLSATYVLLQTAYYTVIVYAMVSFEWAAAKFFWFFFITFLSFLYFTYYGMMAVAVTPNQQVAAVLANAFYYLFNLFSGFFIAKLRIPIWWMWYYYICPIAWTVYGLIVSQYGDVEETIIVPGLPVKPTIKAYIEDHFGYDLDLMGLVAAVLAGFAVFFAFMYAYSQDLVLLFSPQYACMAVILLSPTTTPKRTETEKRKSKKIYVEIDNNNNLI